jgi:hypothetical protein
VSASATHPLQKRREELQLTRVRMVALLAAHGHVVTAQHYGDIELGKRWPGSLFAVALEEITGVPVATLVTWNRNAANGRQRRRRRRKRRVRVRARKS